MIARELEGMLKLPVYLSHFIDKEKEASRLRGLERESDYDLVSALGLRAVISDIWNNGCPVTLRKPDEISEEREMDPSIDISTSCNDEVLLELGCGKHDM